MDGESNGSNDPRHGVGLGSNEVIVRAVDGKSFDFNDPQGRVEHGKELVFEEVTVETVDGSSLSSNGPRDGA